MWTLTCEQVPEVVRLQSFHLPPAGRLPVSNFIAGDKAVLCSGRRRQPAHFDALLREQRQIQTEEGGTREQGQRQD